MMLFSAFHFHIDIRFGVKRSFWICIFRLALLIFYLIKFQRDEAAARRRTEALLAMQAEDDRQHRREANGEISFSHWNNDNESASRFQTSRKVRFSANNTQLFHKWMSIRKMLYDTKINFFFVNLYFYFSGRRNAPKRSSTSEPRPGWRLHAGYGGR